MAAYDGVVSVPGRWGLEDLTLDQGGYRVDADTELLYHFDRTSEGDAAGAWRYAGAGAGPPHGRRGRGRDRRGWRRVPGAQRRRHARGTEGWPLRPGVVWGDFTIEFWLHPATLANGETVLSWEGGVREGGGVATQALRATIRDRRLVWEARDLFTLPGGSRRSFTLTGIRQLLPRAWHHHLLRFDARLGLLEYALDGEVEAIVHTTDNGSEKGSVAVPTIGAALSGPLVVGGVATRGSSTSCASAGGSSRRPRSRGSPPPRAPRSRAWSISAPRRRASCASRPCRRRPPTPRSSTTTACPTSWRRPASADAERGLDPLRPGCRAARSGRAAAGCSCWSSSSPTAGAPRRRRSRTSASSTSRTCRRSPPRASWRLPATGRSP